MAALKWIYFLVIASSITNPAFAKKTAPAKAIKDVPAQVQVYHLDVKQSTIGWTASKKVGSTHHGTILFKEGTVEVLGSQLTGGQFVVDMSTISNIDLKDEPDYQVKLVTHLSSPDFFNVSKYTDSTFKITKVEYKANKEVMIYGDLTMVGTTHPLQFKAQIQSEKGVMTGEAKVKIDRTLWGLKYNSGNFFKDLAAEKIINNDFELDLKLTATK